MSSTPAVTSTPDGVVHILLERALSEAEQGTLEFAVVSCRQALQLAPQSYPAHALHAMLLRRLGRLREALAATQAALKLAPQNAQERARYVELGTALKNGHGECVVSVEQWRAFVQEIKASIPAPSTRAASTSAAVSPKPQKKAGASPQTIVVSNRALWFAGIITVAILLAFLTAREVRLAVRAMAVSGKTVNIQTPSVNVSQAPPDAAPAPEASTSDENAAAAITPAAPEPAAQSPSSAPPQTAPIPPASTPGVAPPTVTSPNVAENSHSIQPRQAVPQSPPRVQSIPPAPSTPAQNNNNIVPHFPVSEENENVGPRFSNP